MGAIQNAINRMFSSIGYSTSIMQHQAMNRKKLSDKQQNSMNKVSEQQEAQRKQRRNFKEYLKNLSIAGNKKVGELPKSAINELAKQYTKSERKKLMDEMDAQKGVKK